MPDLKFQKSKTMKKITNFMIIIAAVFITSASCAQEKKSDEITIKVSAQCEMCKERIEKALSYETGVISSDVDVAKKIVVVKYKATKTNPDKIRLAISKVGYDADDVPADQKAYNKLPGCCKKP